MMKKDIEKLLNEYDSQDSTPQDVYEAHCCCSSDDCDTCLCLNANACCLASCDALCDHR